MDSVPSAHPAQHRVKSDNRIALTARFQRYHHNEICHVVVRLGGMAEDGLYSHIGLAFPILYVSPEYTSRPLRQSVKEHTDSVRKDSRILQAIRVKT
jgi:hypothetical protein